MPLLGGKKNVGHNIEEMVAAGHPQKVAVAAALHKAYDKKKAGNRRKKVTRLKNSPAGRVIY